MVILSRLFRNIVFLTCAAVFFVFIVLGLSAHQVAAKDNDENTDVYSSLRTFTDVLALVRKNYVEEVDFSDLLEGAIQGMLVTLDPHSGYLNPDTYKELQVDTKGQFGGLGIEITVKDRLLTVIAPIEDSPAYRAGVQPGDQIIKIGDEFTKNILLVDAVKKMRGPKGTPITISVHREDVKNLIPITIIRDIIKVKSIRSRMLEENFGYVRLAQFQEGSASEFVKAIDNLNKESGGLDGLVIDLRNNPGGLLTQAIRVADLFLSDGVIVKTKGRLESQKQKYFAHADKGEPKYPLVVLVNEGSASASEIVAGALQDHKRALIVGKKTFGKGSVQTILPMGNGAALRLTTALYFTKSGRSIQAEGIVPDILVSSKRYPRDDKDSLEDEEMERLAERNLPGAIKNPNRKEPKPKKQIPHESKSDNRYLIGSRAAMESSLEELLQADPPLKEALRLLKTWHVFKSKPTIEAQIQSHAQA